jgi:hypothetical protein
MKYIILKEILCCPRSDCACADCLECDFIKDCSKIFYYVVDSIDKLRIILESRIPDLASDGVDIKSFLIDVDSVLVRTAKDLDASPDSDELFPSLDEIVSQIFTDKSIGRYGSHSFIVCVSEVI